jgi:acetyl esterase/lipase
VRRVVTAKDRFGLAHRAGQCLTMLAALACMLSAAACGQEQLAAEAEARARRWGIPAAQIVHDVVYAEYGQRRLMLDLYLPPDRDPAVALAGVIAVRGGAWQVGDKEFFGYIAGQLAMEGFVTASIQYRTANEAKFPAAVQDVKAAVRWMRAHAREYGVAPGAIGAIGGSAGAHLVAMLATTGGVKELEGDGGNPSVSSEVQAVVAMGGAYDLRWKDGVGPEFIDAVRGFIGEPFDANVAAASPLTHVSRRSAPLLLLHSRNDPLAPFEQAVEMEQRYRREGAFARLIPIDAPMHGFWGSPRYFPEARGRFLEFFRNTLKPGKAPR